jgi:hypothetical protein
MAVIKPSLVFEGSNLGDRFAPNPGVYTARLHSAQTTPNSDKSYQLEWVLTDHPSKNYRWIVKQWFPRKNSGFLSQMLWSWKHKKWGDLGENDDERLEALGKLIGEEAHIRVEALDPEKSSSVKVTKVSALDTARPPYWADGEVEAD